VDSNLVSRSKKYTGQVKYLALILIDGVVVHKVEGVKIKIYCPAKTVADCFK
jgi:hypothetical protein